MVGPVSDVTLIFVGRRRRQQGRGEVAMGLFFRSGTELNAKAMQAMLLAKFSKAEKLLRRAISRADEQDLALFAYNLALAQLAQDNVDAGVETMRRAAALGSQDAQEFLDEHEGPGLWDSFLEGFLEGAIEQAIRIVVLGV